MSTRPIESSIYDIRRFDNYYDVRARMQDIRDVVDNPETQRRELYVDGKLVVFIAREGLPTTDFPFHAWQFNRKWGYFPAKQKGEIDHEET